MNKKISLGIAVGIIFIIAIFLSLSIWVINRQQKNEIMINPEQNNVKKEDIFYSKEFEKKLFYAFLQDGKININILDLKNKTTFKSRTIDLKDLDGYLGTSSTAVPSVLFNSQTNNIFILTSGAAEMDGSCIDRDKTCSYRIYKVDVDDKNQKPLIISQFKDGVYDWAINNDKNALIIFSYKSDIPEILKSISIDSGATGIINGKSHLSSDGEYIFQDTEGKTVVLNRDTFLSNQSKIKADISPSISISSIIGLEWFE